MRLLNFTDLFVLPLTAIIQIFSIKTQATKIIWNQKNKKIEIGIY